MPRSADLVLHLAVRDPKTGEAYKTKCGQRIFAQSWLKTTDDRAEVTCRKCRWRLGEGSRDGLW